MKFMTKAASMNPIEDKTVLVTGGTGSFGRGIIKELLEKNPRGIRIFSRDEEKQLDLRRELGDTRIDWIIGDVRDSARLQEATQGADIVYHAAALKVIPTCEENPFECLMTNVLGARNMKEAATRCNVDRSILVSTDKAVKPVNLYGMTKAIAEKLWVTRIARTESKFSVVRYGNVLGSRGSVVPYFKQLIEHNAPLPITHPAMTRFVITLRHAVDLVIHATQSMIGSEIFVPDIPACKIVDLAKVMAGETYPLKFVGIRPGEKIHECLIQEDEFRRTERLREYFIIHPYGKYDSDEVSMEFSSDKARRLEKEELAVLLERTGWMTRRDSS